MELIVREKSAFDNDPCACFEVNKANSKFSVHNLPLEITVCDQQVQIYRSFLFLTARFPHTSRVMYRSIRNFNIPPPPGRPWEFDSKFFPGSREFDYVPDGAGNLNRKFIRLNRKCLFVRFPAQKLKMAARIVFLDDFKAFMFLKDNLFVSTV